VQAYHLRRLIFWPVAAMAVLTVGRAHADDNDPAAIEQRLKAIETTPERKSLLREPAAKARNALKRVLDARAAGDAAHAVELAAMASDWVNLAANVVRAVELEQEVVSVQNQLTELDQKRRHTETLLEATIAQRERSNEELARVKAAGTTPTSLPMSAQSPSGAKATKATAVPKQPKPATAATAKPKPATAKAPNHAAVKP
jgi:hypothetical protein